MNLPRRVTDALHPFTFRHALGVVTADGGDFAVGDTATCFRWMSVSKLLTARVVLAAVERGSIDLDDAVGDAEAGGTVEELLAHASGTGPEGGRQAPPRTKRIYSNAGYSLLGDNVARTYGVSLATLVNSYAAQAGAPGARLTGSAAWGVVSALPDLMAFARELLTPRLIDPHLDQLAVTPAWPGLQGVLPGYGKQADNTWGLGPELRGHKPLHWTAPQACPEVFGHFGQSGSFLWVDRRAGLAACFLGEKPFGPLHKKYWPNLNAAIMDAY